MNDDRPTTRSGPPTRRFGPVTWLAGVGATFFGLCGVVLARAVGHPDYLRGILVISIFCGAGMGMAAGILLERHKVPEFLQRPPWNWFRFRLSFAIGVTTVIAVYVGFIAMFARAQGGTDEQIFMRILLYIIQQGPLALVCIFGAAALINRWHLHPRASMLALIGIAWFVLTSTVSAIIILWYVSIANVGMSRTSAFQYLMVLRSIFQWLNYPICFGLILAAVLVERAAGQNVDESEQTKSAW